jgi:TonB family protein
MNVVSRCLNASAVVCALAAASPGLVLAQTSGPPPTAAPTERAQRDADKVFRMILQHADTPRRTARDDKTAAPAGAPRAPAEGRTAARTASPPPAVPTEAPAAVAAEPTARSLAPAPAPAPAAPLAASEAIELATPVAPVAALPLVGSLAPAPAAPLAAPPQLELVSRVEPEFPGRVLRSVGAGKVVVHFDVQPDGTVARAEVVRSPHRGLNAAAEAAVLAWRFKPTGKTLPGQVEMSFE